MDLNSMTLGQLKQVQALFGNVVGGIPDHAYPVGEPVFVRGVTMHYTGRLARVTAGELVLTDCAWIADSGRFSAALATGVLAEVEPYPDGEVVVSRGAVADIARWSHPLPRAVK